MFSTLSWLALGALVSLTHATPVSEAVDANMTPAQSNVKHFASKNLKDVNLRYVSDSGVCETTPGVHQMSGYIDVGTDMHTWFWFFESRTSPETAPFTLWINGGPGCSSMIGLFQENGPCTVNSDGKTTVLNPNSWNSISNVIYIDQPIGTGFSYGTDTVNSTNAAAPFIWKAFQILFESPTFSKYESREFIFSTESYGGHYGPAFVSYFDQQNALIDKGTLKGEKVTVSALMINNGWYDPLIQYKSYIDFAANAPGYGPLQSASTIKSTNASFYSSRGCNAQMQQCYKSGANKDCINADNTCYNDIYVPSAGNLDSYDLRQSANDPNPFPYEYYTKFLARSDIMKKIGAESKYQECADAPYNLFAKTGDDARTFLPVLSKLVDSKLKTLIWAGDADINCNWLGGYASVLAMDWYGKDKFASTAFTNMTLNGKAVASYKNLDNFSFARVYQAGHEIPAYQPEAALAIFKQIVDMQQLH